MGIQKLGTNQNPYKMNLTNGVGFNFNQKRGVGIPMGNEGVGSDRAQDQRNISSTKITAQTLNKQKWNGAKNAYSGPLHQKQESKSTGSSQVDQRNQRIIDLYGGSQSQLGIGVIGVGTIQQNSTAGQNLFPQNKHQFTTFYGSKN